MSTNTSKASWVGLRVGDRFVVEEELGAGGMGSIYRGRDERLGGSVAIKFLKPSLLDDPVLRERFRREALSLARLRHPSIVTVLDFGELLLEGTSTLYTVLELVRGTTLEELRRSSAGPFPPLRAGPIFDQILDALDACHRSEIVHRDLKPSNIMVSTPPQGGGVDRITIIDFGLARVGGGAIDKLTETGTVQGTPHYMAPEQCRGEDVGAPADVYAAGVVFYEVLAGIAPFQANDAATFMAQHLFVEPPPLGQVVPTLSPGVAAAIHHALAKRPEDRPTASAFRSAIASAFAGTDPETHAEAAALERRRAGGLPRHERAIAKTVTTALVADAQPATLPVPSDEAARVVVWMPQNDRSAALRGCLGTAGLRCELWMAEAVPELQGVGAVVVSVIHLARLGPLRARAPRLPVVVVDVSGPDETTAAIRCGASDMALRAAPDAEIVPKLRRLLRRRGA